MSLITTRFDGNTPGSHRPMPFGVLSRRTALFGAVTIAGFGASFAKPATARPTIVGAVTPISQDADLIALANRVVALAAREQEVSDRIASIDGAITRKIGFPPHHPRPSIGLQTKTEVVGDMLVSTLTRPVNLTERDAILDAHDAAVAAYEQRLDRMQQRFGLPSLEKRADRMARRRDRWTTNLANMRPATAAGLASKAAAMTALMGDDWMSQADAARRHADLLGAVLADAVQFGAGGRA